ncbi:unnamed protein product [Ixodes persulcatus]
MSIFRFQQRRLRTANFQGKEKKKETSSLCTKVAA